MRSCINRPVFHFACRRVFAQEVATFPIYRWPDGSGCKATAAIRTNVADHAINTACAECAFITADAGVERSRRQGFVAMLAIGSEFQHDFQSLLSSKLVLPIAAGISRQSASVNGEVFQNFIAVGVKLLISTRIGASSGTAFLRRYFKPGSKPAYWSDIAAPMFSLWPVLPPATPRATSGFQRR